MKKNEVFKWALQLCTMLRSDTISSGFFYVLRSSLLNRDQLISKALFFVSNSALVAKAKFGKYFVRFLEELRTRKVASMIN